MTPHEVERIAKTAAHEAVKEILEALGLDVTEPLEVQQDQAFLRTMRVGTRKGIFAVWTTLIGVIVTALAGAVWLALNRPPHP